MGCNQLWSFSTQTKSVCKSIFFKDGKHGSCGMLISYLPWGVLSSDCWRWSNRHLSITDSSSDLSTSWLPRATASRDRAGCSSERVGRALTAQGVDSGYTSNAPISQDCHTTLAQDALVIAWPCAVKSQGAKSLTDHFSASLHWQRGSVVKEEAET